MLYTRVVTKAALNTQRNFISTTVRKEPETSWFNPPFSQTVKTVKTLQNHSSGYWINFSKVSLIIQDL